MAPSRYTSHVRVTNHELTTVVFVLEPWANEYLMPPGTEFDLFAEAPKEGMLEVQVCEGKIFVWGWEASSIRVFCKGKEVEANAHL